MREWQHRKQPRYALFHWISPPIDSLFQVKREPASSLQPSDSPLLLARRRVSTGTHIVKPEPTESIIPRKRHSEVAFSVGFDASNERQNVSSSLSKKLKREDSTMVPFGTTHANTESASTSDSIEDTRRRIEDIQLQLGNQRKMRDTILRKKRKTKTDLTRLSKLETSIRDLEAQSNELRQSLPQMAPVRRGASSRSLFPVKAEPSLPMIPKAEAGVMPFVNPAFAGASALASSSKRGLPGLPGIPGIGGLPKPEPDDDDAMDVDPVVGQAAILKSVTGSYIPYVAPVANADSFDDNGDFHGRGRDTFQGPVARADEYVVLITPSSCLFNHSSIEKFLMSAGNAEAFDKNVDLNKCLTKLGLPDITSLLPGMEVPLMPHQVIGVSWMLEKEADKVAAGGILGDEMGLGKVISSLPLPMSHTLTHCPVTDGPDVCQCFADTSTN